MKPKKTTIHRICVANLPLGNILRIAKEFPNAVFRDLVIAIDLGVPEPDFNPEPVTDAESAVQWGIDRNTDRLRVLGPEVEAALKVLSELPAVQSARAEFARKNERNMVASLEVAEAVDREQTQLNLLVSGMYDPDGTLHNLADPDDTPAYVAKADALILQWLGHVGQAGATPLEVAEAIGLLPALVELRLSEMAKVGDLVVFFELGRAPDSRAPETLWASPECTHYARTELSAAPKLSEEAAYSRMRRAYEKACKRLVELGEHPPTVD